MGKVSRELAWVCCFCGEPGDQQAAHTVDIIIDCDADSGTQHLLAHPTCLRERLNSSVPTLIDLDPDE